MNRPCLTSSRGRCRFLRWTARTSKHGLWTVSCTCRACNYRTPSLHARMTLRHRRRMDKHRLQYSWGTTYTMTWSKNILKWKILSRCGLHSRNVLVNRRQWSILRLCAIGLSSGFLTLNLWRPITLHFTASWDNSGFAARGSLNLKWLKKHLKLFTPQIWCSSSSTATTKYSELINVWLVAET